MSLFSTARSPRGELPRGQVAPLGHIFSTYVRPRRLKSFGVAAEYPSGSAAGAVGKSKTKGGREQLLARGCGEGDGCCLRGRSRVTTRRKGGRRGRGGGDTCQLRPPDTQRLLNYDRAKLVSIKVINFGFNNSPASGYTRPLLSARDERASQCSRVLRFAIKLAGRLTNCSGIRR